MNQQSQIEISKNMFPATFKLEEKAELKVVTFTDNQQRPCARIWKGRQSKPIYAFYFDSEEHRTSFINQKVALSQDQLDFKNAKKAERDNFVPTVKVGDIFCSSWGYEQTNVGFYQVLEKPSKHFVIVRELCQDIVNGTLDDGGMSCKVTTRKDKFIEKSLPTKYKVAKYGNEQGIRIHRSETATIWNGREKYKSWYA